MTPLVTATERVIAALRDYHEALLAAPPTSFPGADGKAHRKLAGRCLDDLAGCPYLRPVQIAQWLLQRDLMADGVPEAEANEIAVAATTPVTRT